jgi:hypothetical protein
MEPTKITSTNPYTITRESLDSLPAPPTYALRHGAEVFEVVLDPVSPEQWTEVESTLLRALPCPFIMVEAEPPTTTPDAIMPNVFHAVPRRELRRSAVLQPFG